MASTRMTEDLLRENGELLAPEQVSPVVAYLCHRDCRINGQVLSVGGGHVSAVVTSVTRGITEPDLSAESIRDRLDEIFNPDGAIVPRHLGDELKMSGKGGKVVAVSYKDRSSVLLGGRMADAAYWIDEPSGNFVSSTWYFRELPEWARQFIPQPA